MGERRRWFQLQHLVPVETLSHHMNETFGAVCALPESRRVAKAERFTYALAALGSA